MNRMALYFVQNVVLKSSMSVPDGVNEVVLEFVDSGKKLRLKESREYTIGRMGKTQALIPDVDLSQYGAFQKGVSRLHAILKTYPGKCFIGRSGFSQWHQDQWRYESQPMLILR